MSDVADLLDFIEASKLKARSYRVWHMGDSPSTPGSKFRVGKRIWGGVFADDSQVQVRLGSPDVPSLAFTVCTTSSQFCSDGKITLIGPDFSQITDSIIPFAMVVLVSGKKIVPAVFDRIQRTLVISDNIDGLSLHPNPRKYWLKVGKSQAGTGASFEDLGKTFISLFRAAFPALVEATEIYFFTNNANIIDGLTPFEQKFRSVVTEAFRAKLSDYAKRRPDCEFAWGCQQCEYQKVCEEIKAISDKHQQYHNK